MFSRQSLLAFILALNLSSRFIVAFTLSAGHSRVQVLRGTRDASCDAPLATDNASEVSRRAALVAAAALAAGATPAMAATLERRVVQLEKKNIANTLGAPEKHLPQISQKDDGAVQVVVPHVMDPVKPHFIEYVWIKDVKSTKVVSVQAYKPDDPSPPTLTATVASGTKVKPMLYCNLHGLWEGESFIVA